MLFNVPQNIDVEDKIVGPLTAKHLGWLALLAIILGLLWFSTDIFIFILAGLPITFIILALAFYRPYGQPLNKFVVHAIFFAFKPKMYVWKRTEDKKKFAKEKKNNEMLNTKKRKEITMDEIEKIAHKVDSKSLKNNERISEIVESRTIK